jgi:hypothetical protein
MANVGMQAIGIMAVVAGAVVLFAPLGIVLIVAGKSGRTRVLVWAFGGSLSVALLWLTVAWGLRGTVSAQVAGWWLLGAPWASALGAVAGWRRSQRAKA